MSLVLTFARSENIKRLEDYAQRELEGKQLRVDSDPTDSNAERNLIVAMTNIGYAYLWQRKLHDAEAIFRKAAAREDLEGDDPRGLLTFDGLISTLLDQEKLDEAEKLCETIYPRRVRMLGRTHRDTLSTQFTIATIEKRRGNPAKAEMIQREFHHAQLKTLGETHPVTLITLNNLACSILDQDRPVEAVAMLRQVLAMKEQHVGLSIPGTWSTRRALSLSLTNLGEFAEAGNLVQKNTALSENGGEDGAGELLEKVALLVMILRKQSKWEEAEKQSRRQLEICMKRHGVEHPETKYSYDNLTHALDQQGKPKEAEGFGKMSLEICVSIYGWEHRQIHLDLRNFGAAESEFEKLVNIKSKLYGREDPQTIKSGVQLAWCLQQAKKPDQSEYHYRWLREAQIKIGGEDDPSVTSITNNLGCVLDDQGKLEESLAFFHKAYEGRKRMHGPRAHMTLRSIWTLALVLTESGRAEKAEEWYERYHSASRPDDVTASRPSTVVNPSFRGIIARGEVDKDHEDVKGKGKKGR